jgi:DNA-binding NarL/FixJ family response regulator
MTTHGRVGHQLFISVATVKASVLRVSTRLAMTNRVQIAPPVHDAEPGRSGER